MAVAKLMLLRRVSKLYGDECDIDKAFTFNYKYVIWSIYKIVNTGCKFIECAQNYV